MTARQSAAALGLAMAAAWFVSGGAQTPGAAAQVPPPRPAWSDALAGFVFRFPADHASHPEYRIEWWYYTGNVDAADGRRFGYQVTFFRVGVDPAPQNPSRWAVRDLFMTHLAVSDVRGGRYRFVERLSRGGPGLAGARTDRYAVWNGDWSAGLDAQGRHVLKATDRGVAVNLVLDPGKPPAINGVDGISQKGERAGNASHYYSLMRMPTRGTLVIDDERVAVSGSSWMDHEFGTSMLEPAQQGWDWFALQLDDGSELMLYRLRRADGSVDSRSSGTLAKADGSRVHLAAGDFSLTPGARTFSSKASGARYPLAWTVRIPSAGIDAEVTTPLDDQELRTGTSSGVSYWEGAIDVRGRVGARPVTGRGYLEMTGYAGSMGRVLGYDRGR